MNQLTRDNDYWFEHGIDHCGYDEIAPIFCVGGPVTSRDFAERDLTDIRGVSISQHGLTKGTKWKDLNLSFLFASLPKIEYLRILFDDAVNLDDLGPQPALRRIIIDTKKGRGKLEGEMPQLKVAEVRWPDSCTASLIAPALESLTLTRPLSQDLEFVSHLTSLRDLEINLAQNFESFLGLPYLTNLERLRIRDCPNLFDLNTLEMQTGPRCLVPAFDGADQS